MKIAVDDADTLPADGILPVDPVIGDSLENRFEGDAELGTRRESNRDNDEHRDPNVACRFGKRAKSSSSGFSNASGSRLADAQHTWRRSPSADLLTADNHVLLCRSRQHLLRCLKAKKLLDGRLHQPGVLNELLPRSGCRSR